MKKKRNNKAGVRTLAATAALSLLVGGTAYGETLPGTGSANNANSNATTPNSSQTSQPQALRYFFPDVSPTHWAMKHITKLSLLGIIEGNENGEFRAEDSVTQEQVVTMAIRIMGLEEEALREAEQVTSALPFEVQNYARPYVTMAIDQGLLDISEEIAAASASKEAWGSRKATRDWVAKIVVRAIGKNQDARERQNALTDFADDDAISGGVRGYINSAVELGIVNGFDDNTFRPDGVVTRAQMATFLSRGEPYMENKSARVVTGFIAEIDNTNITVQNELGETSDYKLQLNTQYYSGKDDKRMILSGFKTYHEVYLIQDRGYVYYAELLNDQVPMDTFEGTLVETNVADLTMTVQINGQNQTFQLSSSPSVLRADGTGLSLGELVIGSVVELQRNKVLQNAGVSVVTVKREPVVRTFDAFFKQINGQQIVLTNKATSGSEIYAYPADATVRNTGGEIVDSSTLYEGDELRITIADEVVKSIDILNKAVDEVDQGKLISLITDQRLIIIQKDDGKLATYQFSDTMNVVVSGLPYASTKDLLLEDQVTVEIKGNKVIRTRVSNRSVQSNMIVTIINYDPNSKLLTVLDSYNKPQVYQITDQTTYEVDERAVALADFTRYMNRDSRLSLAVSQNVVRSMQLASTFEGTLISRSVSEIIVQSDTGAYMPFKLLNSPSVQMAGEPYAELNDLEPGQRVKLTLNTNQDAVSRIYVVHTLQYQVKEKGPGNFLILVNPESSDANTYGYDISSSTEIVKEGVTRPRFADINVGDYLDVSFTGFTVDKVTILQSVFGKIESVDANTGRMVVQPYTGSAETLIMGRSTKVRIGGTVLTNLSGLKAGDRVQAVRDKDGNYSIAALRMEQRSFASYDVINKTISFKRRTVDDTTIYSIHPTAYIHKGADPIEPNYFIANDILTVVYLGDKIIEIEKP